MVRVFAAFCVALFALGDAYRGLHLLTEPHVVCAEHGELIHPGPPGVAGNEIAESGRNSYEAPVSGSAVDHHDHCGAAAIPSRQLGPSTADSWVVRAVAPPSAVIALPELPRGHVRPAIAYAPKQGPPA